MTLMPSFVGIFKRRIWWNALKLAQGAWARSVQDLTADDVLLQP